MDSGLRIAREHWEQMRAQAIAGAPLEVCGLLAGLNEKSQAVFPIRNEEGSSTRYRMDPKEQLQAFLAIERAGWEILAIYHSHPAGPPRPSKTDLAEAAYPGVVHLIWVIENGEWNCLAFSLDSSVIQALDLQID